MLELASLTVRRVPPLYAKLFIDLVIYLGQLLR